MQVTVHAAKTNLSKLIELAKSGEEVIIAKGKVPVARIVAIKPRPFTIGLLKNKVGDAPDFQEAMDEADLIGWEGQD
ncbi:MAG: type II toxin-antitoxin system Phd/YefM family antitoxin [Pseudorhizobium sp.]